MVREVGSAELRVPTVSNGRERCATTSPALVVGVLRRIGVWTSTMETWLG
jgi:hypothetical protein